MKSPISKLAAIGLAILGSLWISFEKNIDTVAKNGFKVLSKQGSGAVAFVKEGTEAAVKQGAEAAVKQGAEAAVKQGAEAAVKQGLKNEKIKLNNVIVDGKFNNINILSYIPNNANEISNYFGRDLLGHEIESLQKANDILKTLNLIDNKPTHNVIKQIDDILNNQADNDVLIILAHSRKMNNKWFLVLNSGVIVDKEVFDKMAINKQKKIIVISCYRNDLGVEKEVDYYKAVKSCSNLISRVKEKELSANEIKQLLNEGIFGNTDIKILTIIIPPVIILISDSD